MLKHLTTIALTPVEYDVILELRNRGITLADVVRRGMLDYTTDYETNIEEPKVIKLKKVKSN